MISRRAAITTLAAAWPALAMAQTRERPFRIAILSSLSETNPVSVNEVAWLREGLLAENWLEGRDFVLDARYGNGDYGAFPDLLRDLLSRDPGAVTVGTIAAARAAQSATRTVPIVMLGLNDPVRTGLIASLGTPGGNITGLATLNEDLQIKVFALMQEALPRARSMLVILNPENPSNIGMLSAIAGVAGPAGVSLATAEIPNPAAFEQARRLMDDRRPDVVFVLPDNALAGLIDRIVPAATAIGAPTIGTFAELPDLGGLLAYGFVRRDTVRRAAFYLKRIAGGARPSDLPVEQPTVFRLTVSLRAASTLGLTIPPSIIARADEVIE